MKKVLLAFYLFASSSFVLTAQSFDDDIKKFFEVSGTEASFKNIVPMMIDNFKQNPGFSAVPTEFWDDFSTEALTSFKELLGEMSAVYKKHFTHEDIKQMIVFYESPIGKKFVEKQPLVQSESYVLGSEWGKKLGEKVVCKIQEKKD